MKNITLLILMVATTLLVTSFGSQVLAEGDLTFKLTRGIGACANLPQQSDNFECKAIGWPDQNSRIDLIKQEFVDKNGKQVRWGQFDYYYFFNGIKKCERHKAKIISHLKDRKDINELFEDLGSDRDCIRQGRGWIQTRNVEIWDGKSREQKEHVEPKPKEQKPAEETSSAPKQDYIIPKSTVDEKIKKADADIEYDGKPQSAIKDGMTLELKKSKSNKATVIKYEDQREPQSVNGVSKSPSSERMPKEYF